MNKILRKSLLLSTVFILFSCSSNDDDNAGKELSQVDILTKGRWQLKEDGLIVNNVLIANPTYTCQQENFADFFVDGKFYESDYYLNNGNCVDGNISEKGTWELKDNVLTRIITWEGTENTENYSENIKQLDLNNLILYKTQIANSQGDLETYYFHYIRQ